KEASKQADQMADDLLEGLRRAVRNKPQRYNKLLDVVWNCYFNPSWPTQTDIARSMRISASLVSHYRKIFDNCIQSLNLNVEELRLLNSAFGERLKTVVKNSPAAFHTIKDDSPECGHLYPLPGKSLAAAAAAGWRR
ncbi:MAG TPA: hypothetical protein VFQ92_23465, partial [Blastocatellia bacterium]|nr:hypothetical protein [Blastocatellia bacterium]